MTRVSPSFGVCDPNVTLDMSLGRQGISTSNPPASAFQRRFFDDSWSTEGEDGMAKDEGNGANGDHLWNQEVHHVTLSDKERTSGLATAEIIAEAVTYGSA